MASFLVILSYVTRCIDFVDESFFILKDVYLILCFSVINFHDINTL